MFVYNGSDYTILIIGIVGALLFLVIQLLFCFGAKHVFVKLIPVYIMLLGGVYCLMIYMGIFGRFSVGVLPGHELVALLFAIVAGIACAGIALAWVIYGVSGCICAKKEPKE